MNQHAFGKYGFFQCFEADKGKYFGRRENGNSEKICYDNIGKVPNKGRNFNTQTFRKMYLFVMCMISRHWFQTKLLPYIA